METRVKENLKQRFEREEECPEQGGKKNISLREKKPPLHHEASKWGLKSKLLFEFDRGYFSADLSRHHIIGIDEVGRGALAGPVVACAVCVKKSFYESKGINIQGIYDSKQLNEKERENQYLQIKRWSNEGLLDFTWQEGSVEEIDSLNIVGATQLTMRRCLEKLQSMGLVEKEIILVDGLWLKNLGYAHQNVIQGDAKSLVIAMASIVAKVNRDAIMRYWGTIHPDYGFEKHKGYGTAEHRSSIHEKGILKIHRKRFLKKMSEPNQTELLLELL